MQIAELGRLQGEAFVEPLNEFGQEGVAGSHIADVLKPQFLHQPVLQGPVRPLDPALGLARVGTHDLDVELAKRTAELRNPSATLGFGLVTRKTECLSE